MFYSSLPEPVASLLKKVKSFPLPPGTYLAGGTAATLYYGHRLSVDIDLFTNEGFFTGPIVETLRNNHKFVSEQVSEKDTLLGEIAGVRFSIFKYPYPLSRGSTLDVFFLRPGLGHPKHGKKNHGHG